MFGHGWMVRRGRAPWFVPAATALPARLLTLTVGLAVVALTGSPPATAAVCSSPPVAQAAQTPTSPAALPCRVSSPGELDTVLRSGYTGRVIVPRDVRWDMTPFRDIPLHARVELVGERGDLGSRPMLYTNHRPAGSSYSLFFVDGSDVRVEGLNLRGPKPPTDRRTEDISNQAIAVTHNPKDEKPERRLHRRVVIVDNELQHWATAGVRVNSTVAEVDPKAYDRQCPGGCPHLAPKDPDVVRVERNFIHDNAMNSKGYGVVVGSAGQASIEGNVFEFNRHAVAADGRAYTGYAARFNYVLNGGYKEGGYYNQHFDVHGTGDGGYGGSAGDYFEAAYNTFRGEQRYYCAVVHCFGVRPAFMLRGTPAQGAFFRDNVLVHDDKGEAISLKKALSVQTVLLPASERQFNFKHGGNRYDTDYAAELATGDFDRDGRTDVFVANGTGWFFSRAGVRHWEYLRASNKLRRELGFADVDTDGVTDVLYRAPDGKLGYVRSGRGDLLALTTSPVPMSDLRFGDFDGDGRTDIFYTRANQWNVWYGNARQWKVAGSSNKPIAQLLFGEFDGVRGTDVVGVNSVGWSISSGATQPWARINRLKDALAGAVAADFDGNGRSDIAFGDRRTWRYSPDGRSPLRALRSGLPAHAALSQLPIGRFDRGATRAQVLGFESYASLRINRLVLWPGVGSSGAFRTHSDQNMR